MKDLRADINLDGNNFDFWKDSIRARVKTANDTSSRARYTLMFLSLVSAGLIMSVFSYFYSWNKDFAYEFLKDQNAGNIVRSDIIREYVSTQMYQLPILGIKIMASDIQIFGPLILLVVSTWNYYEVRREHFTFGRLLGDINILLKDSPMRYESKAIILSQEVFHNLMGYTVFNVFHYHNPIKKLSEQVVGNIGKVTFDAKIRSKIIQFLASTPLVALLFIATTRILTFTLLKSAIYGQVHNLHTLSKLRSSLLILSSVLIFGSLIVCYFNMRRVHAYTNATRNLTDAFRRWAFDDEV